MNFWSTVRGVHLADMLLREIPKIAKEMKRANDLKEEELKNKEHEGEKK